MPRGATEQEIKKSFRKIARELHPDVNGHDPDAEEKFKEAAEAYEVLSDEKQRQTYDQYGPDGLKQGGFSSQAQGFGSIDDLFSAFFGGAGGGAGFGRRGPAPGADVGVGDRDRPRGRPRRGRAKKSSSTWSPPASTATATAPSRAPRSTPARSATAQGELRSVANTAFGQMVRAVPCDVCHGEGKVAETPCGVCSGLGRSHTQQDPEGRRARRDRVRPAHPDRRGRPRR